MAEKEVKKEKASFGMNIWFIIFIVYLVLSLVYILNQTQTIATLNDNLLILQTKYDNEIIKSNQRSENIIDDLSKIIEKYRAPEVKEEVNTPSTPVGTYTGSSVVAEGEVALTMSLVLAENNVATLTLTNESGDSLLNGTYNVVDATVNFTSEDGLTAYAFTIVDDSTLKLVDPATELTLVK